MCVVIVAQMLMAKGLATVWEEGVEGAEPGMYAEHKWKNLNQVDMLVRKVFEKHRSLGAAIILAAIDDYQHCEGEEQVSATSFLFPETAEMREHLGWALGLAPGINGGWLRSALDRFRPLWDAGRRARERERTHRLPVPSAYSFPGSRLR